jgi:hypothetical protein
MYREQATKTPDLHIQATMTSMVAAISVITLIFIVDSHLKALLLQTASVCHSPTMHDEHI